MKLHRESVDKIIELIKIKNHCYDLLTDGWDVILDFFPIVLHNLEIEEFIQKALCKRQKFGICKYSLRKSFCAICGIADKTLF